MANKPGLHTFTDIIANHARKCSQQITPCFNGFKVIFVCWNFEILRLTCNFCLLKFWVSPIFHYVYSFQGQMTNICFIGWHMKLSLFSRQLIFKTRFACALQAHLSQNSCLDVWKDSNSGTLPIFDLIMLLQIMGNIIGFRQQLRTGFKLILTRWGY